MPRASCWPTANCWPRASYWPEGVAGPQRIAGPERIGAADEHTVNAVQTGAVTSVVESIGCDGREGGGPGELGCVGQRRGDVQIAGPDRERVIVAGVFHARGAIRGDTGSRKRLISRQHQFGFNLGRV